MRMIWVSLQSRTKPYFSGFGALGAALACSLFFLPRISLAADPAEWASPKTAFPILSFSSPDELKSTLADHSTVAKYYKPKGPMVVPSSYRYEVSPDHQVSSLKYDVGLKFLGMTRPFQGDVTFSGCAADLSKCSLRIDLRNSSPGIRDMIPEMKLTFGVVGKNPDGSLKVQPRLAYQKGPKYEELLGKLPSGVIDNATRNQIEPLLKALERYRAEKNALGQLMKINDPDAPLSGSSLKSDSC
jgi:hypothetical protein